MERKRRHQRSRQPRPFVVTQNVLDILTLLRRYKYLRSTALISLLPHRSADRIRRNLRTLFDNGLILKPREQLRGYNSFYAPDIYALDRKGDQVLDAHAADTAVVTRLYRPDGDAPVKNFAHAMMICDALSSIEVGARDRLIPWSEIVARTKHPEPSKLAASLRHTFGTRTENLDTHIIPDGFFGIRHGAAGAAFFALEAEKFNPIEPTTLKRASFLKKLLAYRDIIRRQEYKQQLGVPNMRVLVVAPTKQRIQHMIELTERLVGQSNLFLFRAIPVQEHIFKAPPVMPELFTEPWLRAGLPPLRLENNQEVV